jgi:RNA polymerase sigma factor (sigma-70 family)
MSSERTMDDLAKLVQAARAGDLDAFGRMVERFQVMACAVAYAMLGDAHLAEDAAQEAFIEAFLCLPKLREPAAFPGWFRRIVVKRSDRLIRGKAHATVPIEAAGELPSGQPDPAALAEARELQRGVRAALAGLPDIDRQLIMLFYMAGYTQHEVAAIAELPAGVVKKRLYRARQRLRERMDGLVRDRLQERATIADDGFARTVRFFIAVRIGDVSKVRAYLDDDPALLDTHERWDEATARQHGLPLVSQFTALHRAAFNGHSSLVALLLQRRADTEARTRSGQTPLHVAVSVDQPAIVAQLLAAGADPNHAADHGLTPLHFAAMRDRRELAAQLLDAGADPEARDRHGRTPLGWARLKGFETMAMLLAQHLVWKGGSR